MSPRSAVSVKRRVWVQRGHTDIPAWVPRCLKLARQFVSILLKILNNKTQKNAQLLTGKDWNDRKVCSFESVASNERAKRLFNTILICRTNKRAKNAWIQLFIKGKRLRIKNINFSIRATMCLSANVAGQDRAASSRPSSLSRAQSRKFSRMAVATSSGLGSQLEMLYLDKVERTSLSRTWTPNWRMLRDTRLLFWKMTHQCGALTL